MMTRIFLILFIALPAFAENARRIERVSMLNEGSTVDSIVWYQGESVTLDVFAKWGTARYAWPETASSVLRVWKADAPGTLYVDKTNAVYSAANGQTRNTLTPAQSNLGTNDYKFAVAVYDSTTFMGIAAEGDLEVRYAPQTGLPLVDGIASWPTELDDLSDVDAASPDAGQVLGYDGTNWVAVAAGSGSGDVTGITSTDSSITVTSGTGPIPNVALPSTLPARNGSLLTALNASALASGTVPTARLGSGTANSGAYLTGASTWAQLPFATTNAVRDAVADIYLPLALGGGTTINYGSYGMFVRGGEGILDVVNGIWRGGNGQTSMGVMLDETPYIWFENDTDFSILSLRADTFWLTTNTNNTTLVKLRASLSASDLLTGTIPDAVFPATLPAVSGANLTGVLHSISSGSIGPTQLASTAVTAASYTIGNGGFTVDADGRLTSATSGTGVLVVDADKGDITVSGTGTVWNIDPGAITPADLPTSQTTPAISWASSDCTFHTTAGVWWYTYENSGIDFGAYGLRAAAADDQTGTLRTKWVRRPSEASAYHETSAIVLTFAVSSTAGVTEVRGLRLMGRNAKTDTPTTVYTDTTTRDGHASSAGALVTAAIVRSSLSTTNLFTDYQAELDVSVEDAEVLSLESIEVRFQ